MNTRFAVAVHILTLLASQPDSPASSEWIAGSVNTNPALIRRLLLQLAKAGLTRAQRGAGGGALLARPADTISLADVYEAVQQDADLLPLHNSPNPKCPIGRHIRSTLDSHIAAAEVALRESLARTTLADLTRDVLSPRSR